MKETHRQKRRTKKGADSYKRHLQKASGNAAGGIRMVIYVWSCLAPVRKPGPQDPAPGSHREGLPWNDINSQALWLTAGITLLA